MPSRWKILAKKYRVGDYAQDINRLYEMPKPGKGDGRIYVVVDVFEHYISKDNPDVPDPKSGLWTNSHLKHAKRFYSAQSAWGWAKRSIYPAFPMVVAEEIPSDHPAFTPYPDEPEAVSSTGASPSS